ncbi:hypothetical protein ECH74042_A5356 [Escherichia coli O157:H7 str. EC4042]|nr:hypothetical protein ECH74042_A5356 [Escherichia coli O157:H7 str. EC4042]
MLFDNGFSEHTVLQFYVKTLRLLVINPLLLLVKQCAVVPYATALMVLIRFIESENKL